MRDIQRNRDKVTRAYDAAPMIEAGRVYLPSNNPWIGSFIQEHEMFPNGKHDDQVDPMMDAVQDMLIGSHATSGILVPSRKR